MSKKKTNTTKKVTATESVLTLSQTHQDIVLALLVVSLTVNLFVLVGWVTLQVTSVYDSEVAVFLFTR